MEKRPVKSSGKVRDCDCDTCCFRRLSLPLLRAARGHRCFEAKTLFPLGKNAGHEFCQTKPRRQCSWTRVAVRNSLLQKVLRCGVAAKTSPVHGLPSPADMEQISVRLQRTESGEYVPATVERMTAEHFSLAAATWGEEFYQRHQSFFEEDELAWRQVAAGWSELPDDSRNGRAIVHQGRIEGLLLFRDSLQPSRKTPGVLLLYVHYLASAPWNHPNERGRAHFRDLERILTVQAVRESIRLGSPGRVGLHALTNARARLATIGFEVLEEPSDGRGPGYCELRPPGAFRLLSEFDATFDAT